MATDKSEFQNLLAKLNFLEYFPQKLTLQEALTVTDCLKPNVPRASTNNPHHLLRLMLEHIKMANNQFRRVHLYEQMVIVSCSAASSDESDASEDEEIDKIVIHPMDSLLALIHCADNFLRQEIFSKLVSCQVAIPLLLPDPPPSNIIVLPLWAMRSIVKNWKTKISKSTWITYEERLVNFEAPMVSFMRLSHPGFSKSKLLNSVIDDSNRNFFFNHECEGSSVERKFVDGLVEACWYLPAGEESDVFNDLIMFTNLRGNSSDNFNSRQVKFLLAQSIVSFVFMLESDICPENFENFQSSERKIFLISSCSKSKIDDLKQWVPNSAVIKLAKKEPTVIVKSIRDQITKIASSCKESQQSAPVLSCYTKSSLDQYPIKIDETKCDFCWKSKSKAEEIIKQMKGTQVKEEMLPLQGPALWHQWAAHNKSQNRAKLEDTGEKTLDTFYGDLQDKMINIRKKQCQKAKNPSEVLSKFITNVSECSKEERAYFLRWLKFYLDDRALTGLSETYKTANVSVTEEQQQLDKIHDTDIIGVEHFFRELGQMYESVMVENDRFEKNKVKQFPKVIAELLLSGQPLEIVDGDAAHVPITWVKAVLDEVKERIENSKLLVLSVLGIQSTGKSTLMNTMFGVRFSVSAGRCTRGAYLQLLKVKAVDLECDYMLIIDTEGLRAPELDSLQTQHDNELAALVIGLADVTIVNIFGEVPADISDILQTTVHAFIRMKKAEMKPSCQFVRHCVASVSASKTREGIGKFQETLDRMTKIAAKAECCEGQFEQFSDVITFDNKTDIQNFHALWDGNPPMAPVNPLYCQDADTLRNKLLKLPVDVDSTLSLCTVQNFQHRLETLWEAILKENFVFSFKNTLEVEAFSCLDTEYGEWSWRLQSCYVKWESDAVTTLSSTSLDYLSEKSNEQIQEIHKTLDNEYDNIIKSVDKFFEDADPMIAETMIQWKTKYGIKVRELRNDHKDKANKYCNTYVERRRARSTVDEKKKHELEKIDCKLKQLILETKVTDGTELSPEELATIEEKFDKQWKEWMKEVNRIHPPPQFHDIRGKITYCLRTHCNLKIYDTILVEEEKEKSLADRGGLPLKLRINQKRHINDRPNLMQNLKKITSHSQASVPTSSDMINSAEKKTQKILEDIQDRFSNLDTIYEDHHIIGFVRDLLQAIDEFESMEEVLFTFTAEYRIDLIMEVAGYALKKFLQVQQRLIDEHLTKYLESLRPIYEQKFHALCKTIVQEKALAINLVNFVEIGTNHSLKEKLKGVLPDEVRASHSLFGSKKNLTGHLLQNLLKKKSFDAYKLYLQNVSECFYNFIREYTEEYCVKQGKIVPLAEFHLERKITLIRGAAQDAQSSQQLEEWLTKFHKNTSATIQLKEDELKILLQQDPAVSQACDIKFFTEEFIKELDKCHDRLKERLSDPENKTLQVLDEVAVILRDSVAGCCEQCPFCKEQCEVLTVNHPKDHHCSMHRPQCLGGYRHKGTLGNQKMALENCTDLVASTYIFRNDDNNEPIPFKKYRYIYPNWRIPEGGRDATPYWKWFIVTYKNEIAKFFGHSFPSTSHWERYTEDIAERDLNERYQLND